MQAREVVQKARALKKCIPAFNVPRIEMLKPIAEAVRDENSVAMIQVARVEWEKLGAASLELTAEAYARHKNRHTLLHLDHIPVIDENYQRVDYMPYIGRAIAAGYQSVMVDGSRLNLDENIAATKEVAQLAHSAGIACEGELGAVLGHENVALPPYDVIFQQKMGFTRLDEALLFARESGCDWLSVAAGNIHGPIAEALRSHKKPEARLDTQHIEALCQATGLPLVLHGGSGINRQCLLTAFEKGIAKINVGTEMRQCYEAALGQSGDVAAAQHALYLRVRGYIHDDILNTNLMDLMAQ